MRELYWDLISRRGFTIAYLRPFTAQQIEQYVKRAKPTTTLEAMSKIHQTYNLMELSQRPMLLDMIVKSIDKIGDSEINLGDPLQSFYRGLDSIATNGEMFFLLLIN